MRGLLHICLTVNTRFLLGLILTFQYKTCTFSSWCGQPCLRMVRLTKNLTIFWLMFYLILCRQSFMTWNARLNCTKWLKRCDNPSLFFNYLQLSPQYKKESPKIEKAHNKSAVDEATRARVWRCYWFERHLGGRRRRTESGRERSPLYRQNPPIATAFDASKARTQAPGRCRRPTDAENDDTETKTIDKRSQTDEQIQRSVWPIHESQLTHTSAHTNTRMHAFTRTQLRRRRPTDQRRRRTAVGVFRRGLRYDHRDLWSVVLA